MSIAADAFVTTQTPVANLTAIMFAPGDEVKAKNRMLPFWMTVSAVNERTGYCQCSFGSTDNYAGNFHHSELLFNGGSQLNQTAS